MKPTTKKNGWDHGSIWDQKMARHRQVWSTWISTVSSAGLCPKNGLSSQSQRSQRSPVRRSVFARRKNRHPMGPLSEQGFNIRCFNMLQHASTQFVGTRGLFEMTRNDRKWPKMDGIVGFKSYSSWFPNPTGAVTCWRRNLRGRINEVLRLVDAGEVWQLVTTCHTTP